MDIEWLYGFLEDYARYYWFHRQALLLTAVCGIALGTIYCNFLHYIIHLYERTDRKRKTKTTYVVMVGFLLVWGVYLMMYWQGVRGPFAPLIAAAFVGLPIWYWQEFIAPKRRFKLGLVCLTVNDRPSGTSPFRNRQHAPIISSGSKQHGVPPSRPAPRSSGYPEYHEF